MMESVFITAVETACVLGVQLEDCLTALRERRGGLSLSACLPGAGFPPLPVGALPSRTLLKGRRYGAASNAAVQAATTAIRRAGWSAEEIRASWLYGASSRGNAGEIMGVNAWRRPLRKFSASNTMHCEIPAAVSIELGIRGPWQMVSNGCSSGLDALGMAWMAVGAGLAPRALVVAVDLPLIAALLQDFHETGLLSSNGINDPFATGSERPTSGFLPGEAAVAVTLERDTTGRPKLCRVEHYSANSDAYDALRIPADGGGIEDCVRAAVQAGEPGKIVALCPHATGTLNHAQVEPPALLRALDGKKVPLLPLKPQTGHTLGASGLLDVALLAACMADGWLPAVLPGLTPPSCGLPLNEAPLQVTAGDRVVKLASGMGGHNAAVSLAVV
ncbi:beta-ketoacyl synthase N-terminal-like domain-containing protein [Prosthecobacter sp.]|uniref:beta-ketoacyl synthase N-terminal-like domain-containing protein n=1 Tax=Prosthecobacter sp. TaxID=1965333 RepID=UPI002488B58C|nr:beta-ketoacyl synthase N-terminal-like domain-containing protein [Prosthecobacter sp.]MDI1313646.1 beta-ketoacyl synthase N-terminal-like domain-containing protein [Prosthecobacter sp.]